MKSGRNWRCCVCDALTLRNELIDCVCCESLVTATALLSAWLAMVSWVAKKPHPPKVTTSEANAIKPLVIKLFSLRLPRATVGREVAWEQVVAPVLDLTTPATGVPRAACEERESVGLEDVVDIIIPLKRIRLGRIHEKSAAIERFVTIRQ